MLFRSQRSGLNTECKLLLLSHAFDTLDCIAVEFRTHVLNTQSRRAIERLGAPFAPTMAFLATLATIPALQAEAGERRAIRRLARRGPDLRVLIDLFDAAVRAVPRLAIALESRGVRLPSRAAPASRLRPSTFGRADAILFASSVAALALAVAWNAVGAPLPAILAR